MPRTEMTAVEDLGPFDVPTATVGDNIYNGSDGLFWLEDPRNPASIGLCNLSGNASATVTFAPAPNTPGSPAAFTTPTIPNSGMLLIPPGFLPVSQFRRRDDEATDPGAVYITGSDDQMFACIVRGPGAFRPAQGNGGPALTGSRTLATVNIIPPRGSLPATAPVITDTDGLAYFGGRETAMMFFRGAGGQTVTFSYGENNRYGSTTDVSVVAASGNMMIVFPPGVPDVDLVKRVSATNNQAIYFSSNQAASARYMISGVPKA